MSRRIEIAPAARRDLHGLKPKTRRRVQAAIDLLAEDPRPPAATMLPDSGGAWQVRVGDQRLIYDISETSLLMLVLRSRSSAGRAAGL